jgi:hypothetical protein
VLTVNKIVFQNSYLEVAVHKLCAVLYKVLTAGDMKCIEHECCVVDRPLCYCVNYGNVENRHHGIHTYAHTNIHIHTYTHTQFTVLRYKKACQNFEFQQ